MAENTGGQNIEQSLLQAVTIMRRDPEKYRQVRSALAGAGSDQERVRQLLSFATSERDLAALMPTGTAEPQAAITTVTVTTVFIIADSAY